jgi:hypothetical protein
MKGKIFGPHAVPMYKDYGGGIHTSGVSSPRPDQRNPLTCRASASEEATDRARHALFST